MRTKIPDLLNKVAIRLAVLVLGGFMISLSSGGLVSAACPALLTTNGTATMTVNAPVDGTYRVWVRMMTPDSANDTVYLEVDDTSCGNLVGGSGFSANTWRWVDYTDGNSNDKLDVSLTAGNHTVKLTGAESGVKIDRVLFLTDTGCTPTGTGDNCSGTPDTTDPTVSISSPTNGATVSGTTSITASASDSGGGGLESVEFFIDDVSVFVDTTNPPSYSWDTTQVSDGSHTIYAIARDTWNNATTSSTITVTVANNPTGIADLSFLPSSGNTEPGSTPAVRIIIDSGSDQMDTAQVRVTYDPTILEYVSTNSSQSDFSTAGSVTTGSNYVQISRSNPTNITGSNELARINFNVLTTASGSHTLDFSSNANQTFVRVDGDDLTLVRNSGSYTANDVTSPSVPSNLTATDNSDQEIDLSWTASTDNVGVTRYIVERDNSVLDSNVTGTTYTDTSPTPNVTHSYQVRAVDAAGNQSSLSVAATASVTSIVGDFNLDGNVDVFDLSIFLSNWGTADEETDLNNDGTVNIFDFSMFLTNWGA